MSKINKQLGARCYYLNAIWDTISEKDCEDGGTLMDDFYLALAPCDSGKSVTFAFGSGGGVVNFALDDINLHPTPCPAGEFMDCAGTCLPNEDRQWIGERARL